MERLRFYADKDLEMTVAKKEVFEHAFTQGEFEMADIIDISEIDDGQGFDVKANWVGFDEGKSSWEPLATFCDGASRFIKSEPWKFYDITFKVIGGYFIVELVWSCFW